MRGQPRLAAIECPTRAPPFVNLAVERLWNRRATKHSAARCEARSRAHPLQRPPSVEYSPKPTPALPRTPRLATHLQSPVSAIPPGPSQAWRSPPHLTQPNSNPYPSFINYPCRAFFGHHSYHTFPVEVYFFTITVGTPPALQHCTSTRRPANLEISVLPSSHPSITSPPQPCRRSLFSSPRTHGHAQQHLNGYAITIITLHFFDIRWISNA
jgi:hypothetical protein